jgi:hypothetical protein
MSEEPVLVEQRGSVLLITLNRPDQRNAIDYASAEGIAAALDRLDAEDALSVGVITGAGSPGYVTRPALISWLRSIRWTSGAMPKITPFMTPT